MTPTAMTARLFACAVVLAAPHTAFAGPIQIAASAAQAPAQVRGSDDVDAHPMAAGRAAMAGTDVTLAAVANTLLKDDTVICADAVLGCRYGSRPKRSVLPWDIRRAGEGVAFTIFGTVVTLRRDGVSVVRSVMF